MNGRCINKWYWERNHLNRHPSHSKRFGEYVRNNRINPFFTKLSLHWFNFYDLPSCYIFALKMRLEVHICPCELISSKIVAQAHTVLEIFEKHNFQIFPQKLVYPSSKFYPKFSFFYTTAYIMKRKVMLGLLKPCQLSKILVSTFIQGSLEQRFC